MDEEKIIEKPKAGDNVTIEKKQDTVKRKVNNKRVFVLLGILMSFFVVLFCFLFIFVMSPKKVVKSYVAGMKEFNSTRVVNTMYDEFLDNFKKETGDDFKVLLDKTFDVYKKEKYEIESYEINFNYSKFTDNQFNAYVDMLSKSYGIKKGKIKELRYYPVRYTSKFSDGSSDIFTQRIILAKIGFKWYVFPVGEEEIK